jgi:tetratricopeptide (TPR) repeat protein
MRTTTAILATVVGIVLSVGAVWGQSPPKMKSQKELDAWNAINTAPDFNVQLQKIDDFLAAFADSDYRLVLLDRAVTLAASKNDYALTMAWGQRDLDANPNSYIAMMSLANVTAATTKQFDLDKDQKLNQAEKWAHGALDVLKTATRPFIIQEDKWPGAKKFYEASCHQALGLIASDRRKFDVSSAEFQTAYDILPEPAYLIRAGEANLKGGKYDDAIAVYDKVLALPDLNAIIKQVAEREKADALRRKGIQPAGTAPAATAPASNPPPPAGTPPPAGK